MPSVSIAEDFYRLDYWATTSSLEGSAAYDSPNERYFADFSEQARPAAPAPINEEELANLVQDLVNVSTKPNYTLSAENIVTLEVFQYEKECIESCRKLLRSDYLYRSQLVKRIFTLAFPDEEDIDDEWPDVSLHSLSSLVEFFSSINRYRVLNAKPTIFMTHDGELRAEWQIAKNKFLGLQFIEPERYRYVIFSPSSTAHYKANRESGECGPKRLYELIKNFRWL